MFVVCKVDPYDDFGLVHQIVGCFETVKDAETTAEYLNLQHVHNLIKRYEEKQDNDYCKHLRNIVEQNQSINEPYDTYIVIEVAEPVVYTESDIIDLRKRILDH